MSLDQLAKLLQQLDKTEARTQAESDILILDNNNTTVMPDADNTNLNNYNSYNSYKDQLWNKELLKNYILNILNMLKFSYSISLKTLLALLTNTTYQILNNYDKDSYNISFKS